VSGSGVRFHAAIIHARPGRLRSRIGERTVLTARTGKYGSQYAGGRTGAVSVHRACGELREALAVYVLGAIEPADRNVVDRHLAGCADCRDELTDLAGLPGLLRRVPVKDAAALADAEAGVRPGANLPSGPVLHSMLAGASRRRRRRTRTWAAAAVATGLVDGAGVIAGWQTALPSARPPAASAPAWTGTSRAVSQQTGASATVRYAATRWGLQLSVQVGGIPPGTACELEVIGRRGQEVTAGSWTIAAGPASWYPASAAVRLPGIRGFVLSSGSRTLVRIPTRADTTVSPGSPAGTTATGYTPQAASGTRSPSRAPRRLTAPRQRPGTGNVR
jgi:hypothetical protein